MRYGIECNIIDIANQLFFAYQRIAPKVRVFMTPPIKTIKVLDFICALEEKQEVWYKMMATPAFPN